MGAAQDESRWLRDISHPQPPIGANGAAGADSGIPVAPGAQAAPDITTADHAANSPWIAGRSASLSWKSAGRALRCSLLERRIAASASRLADFFEQQPRTPMAASGAAVALIRQRRLLDAAVKESRDSLRWKLSIPQVHAPDCAEAVPRAYFVARAFLSASSFSFSEAVLRQFLAGIRENTPLELAELWLLKPMMTFVLLEEIAAQLPCAVAPPEAQVQSHSDSAKQAGGSGPILLLQCLEELSVFSFKDTVLALSVTEAILREDPARVYSQMDFESCELYRAAVQELAAGAGVDEFSVARRAVELARDAARSFALDARALERRSHVGYYLVGSGRNTLRAEIGYHSRGAQRIRDIILGMPEMFYLLSIELLIFLTLVFLLSGVRLGPYLLAAVLLLLLPASEAAVEAVNQVVSFFLPPRLLPRLDFTAGIPEDCVTIVAIPTLLVSEPQIRDLVRNLEIRYAGNRDPNLFFALLTDPPDSSQPFDERDQYVSLCSALIEDLNRKYSEGRAAPFFHFHRHRVFNELENKWMGWERKRGKLLDFNDFLRGSYDRFPVKVGDLSVVPRVRFVITLDSDTQLPPGVAKRLIATLAHPLNRARVNHSTNTVVEGYGILQPRVGISVQSANRSRLAYIYSGQTGLDSYTHAVSNVYQDLFGEGSFTGKGIYEVDVFREVLHGRFPTNAILSHDLIEGAYARAGLVSDIEVIDDYPSHFSAHSRRKHRWIRGDWQIMRWLLPRVLDSQGKSVKNPLNFVSRWKILDNLRRSVIEAATFVLLLASWFYLPYPAYWTFATVALLLIPSYVRLLLSFSRARNSDDPRTVLRQITHDFVSGQIDVLIFLAFLAHQTLVTLDAVFRTVFRLTISRRNLLEWETAAQSEMERKRKTPVDIYLDCTPFLAIAIGAALAWFRPAAFPAALPVLLLWLFSKPAARWLDHPLRTERSTLTPAGEQFLRASAIRTWRYFHQLAAPENNFLIPDNLYEQDFTATHALSPTNLGLQLNAQYAAFDLGFLTLDRFAENTERILDSARRLPRFNGHFLNWYDTRSLLPLGQRFVSTVDSGNLACSLWSLKQGCLAAATHPIFPESAFLGFSDHLGAALDALQVLDWPAEKLAPLQAIRAEAARLPRNTSAWSQAAPAFQDRLEAAVREAEFLPAGSASSDARWWLVQARSHLQDILWLSRTMTPWVLPEFASLRAQLGELLDPRVTASLTLRQLPDFVARLQRKLDEYSFWTGEASAKEALRRRLTAACEQARHLESRLLALASVCDALVREMDFTFLYDERRGMLSIGYNADAGRLEKSCYDLLASESRSAVFVAIAKGDIPQDTWFRLGRSHTEAFGRHVLLSWTGTMFEYLMPALWLKTYPETLLENSMAGAVHCQRSRLAPLGIPWGISEAGCSLRNESNHYVYRAFGLPDLAINPELDRRLVISPYSSFLALHADASAAVSNLVQLEAAGLLGSFGFYEAADFGDGPSGASADGKRSFEVVRSWMAHHQGMSLLSICNLLSDGVFQRLFHEEVMVAASERILHERRPIFAPAQKQRRPRRSSSAAA